MVGVVGSVPHGGGAPRAVELPARAGRPRIWNLVRGTLLLTVYVAGTFFRQGPWWAAASVAGLVILVAALYRGRGPLRLNAYGMSVKQHGRRRTYAWRDVEIVGPVVMWRNPWVVVEVSGTRRRRRMALETYGRTAEQLSQLLTAYRARALAADTGVDRTTTRWADTGSR